jgi:membrane glycosyltransferase
MPQAGGERASSFACDLCPPTAIVVTVRGVGSAFELFILSESQNASAEEPAVAAFRAEDRDPARIHYRRRPTNAGFKAGNIMDFLDRHADRFELMLTLDADSQMSVAAVLRLVRAMQADPSLGIAQHLTVAPRGQPGAALALQDSD